MLSPSITISVCSNTHLPIFPFSITGVGVIFIVNHISVDLKKTEQGKFELEKLKVLILATCL